MSTRGSMRSVRSGGSWQSRQYDPRRTQNLETWCRAIMITDYVVCGLGAISLLLLMCLPQYFRDFMFRVIDEMDYDIQRKEEMKPFYEHVLIPIILAAMGFILLFHFALTVALSFGISKPNISKLRGWILVQIVVSMIMSLCLLILAIRFAQYFLGFLPFILFQLYRFASIIVIFKFEQALIYEDERRHRKAVNYRLTRGSSPTPPNQYARSPSPSLSFTSPMTMQYAIPITPPQVKRIHYKNGVPRLIILKEPEVHRILKASGVLKSGTLTMANGGAKVNPVPVVPAPANQYFKPVTLPRSPKSGRRTPPPKVSSGAIIANGNTVPRTPTSFRRKETTL